MKLFFYLVEVEAHEGSNYKSAGRAASPEEAKQKVLRDPRAKTVTRVWRSFAAPIEGVDDPLQRHRNGGVLM